MKVVAGKDQWQYALVPLNYEFEDTEDEDLGPPPEESLESLSELVSVKDPLVAYWAITLLGRSGSSAKQNASGIVAALKASSEDSVKERAAWALGKIGATSPTHSCPSRSPAAPSWRPAPKNINPPSIYMVRMTGY